MHKARDYGEAGGTGTTWGNIEEINTEIDRNLKEITRLILKRKDLVEVKRQRIHAHFKAQMEALNRGDRQVTIELREVDKDLNTLLTNVEQNPRLRNTLNNMWSQSITTITKAENSRTTEFWGQNKKLENEIDLTIKRLKTLDQNIEHLGGEFFNIGRSIDDNDEQIREILSRRQENNIKKAEPFSQEKHKLQDGLRVKYQEREKIKEEKMDVVRKILTLLESLRHHRETRMKNLFQVEDADMPIYQQFIEGLEKIMKTRENLSHTEADDTKLTQALAEMHQVSEDLAEQFVKAQIDESGLFDDLSKSYGNKLRLVSLEKALIGDVIPDSAARNLTEAIRKVKDFKKVLDLSSNEKSLVKQGLQKTKETAEIFDQVLRSIESEKSRRHKLMQDLLELQEFYNSLRKKEEKKINLGSELESLSLKKRQLEKRLADLASKADLDGYKRVSESLQDVEAEEGSVSTQVDQIDESLLAGQSNLQSFSGDLQSQYSDILKEAVPPNWLKKHDLRKPSNILELNTYLRRTFQRLNI